jgi:predicted transcriptional regulator
MATISLNLPDKVYQQAARLAQLMNRDVSRLLAETIESALSPLGTFEADIAPVENLSDRKF